MTILHSKNHSVEWDEKDRESLWEAIERLNGVFVSVTTNNPEIIIKITEAVPLIRNNEYNTTYGVLTIEPL